MIKDKVLCIVMITILFNICYPQKAKEVRTLVKIDRIFSDSLILSKSNQKCIDKYIKKDRKLINVYYRSSVLKNDSISLKLNSQSILNKKIKLSIPLQDIWKLYEIEIKRMDSKNTFRITNHKYCIRSLFELNNFDNLSAIEILFLLDENKVENSTFIVYPKRIDFQELNKVILCSKISKYK